MTDRFRYSMTGDQYRAMLKRLGFADPNKPGDEGISAAGRFFGASPRAAQNWPVDGPPNAVAVALHLMHQSGMTYRQAAGHLLPLGAKAPAGLKRRMTPKPTR